MFTNTTLNDSELFEAVSYYYSLRAARHIYVLRIILVSMVEVLTTFFAMVVGFGR